MELKIPVDIPLLNRIHDLIASGFENTSVSTQFCCSSRSEIMIELKKQAIKDSREKAALLAEATGTTVAGIDSANLEGYRADMDVAVLDLSVDDNYMDSGSHCIMAPGRIGGSEEERFIDKLTPDKITLNAEVRIVWLLEQPGNRRDR